MSIFNLCYITLLDTQNLQKIKLNYRKNPHINKDNFLGHQVSYYGDLHLFLS